jgi:hypothetical protein
MKYVYVPLMTPADRQFIPRKRTQMIQQLLFLVQKILKVQKVDEYLHDTKMVLMSSIIERKSERLVID